MKNEKVLITGAAGQIAFPICEHLAPDNEVWGLDLYDKPGSRERVEAVGVRPIAIDVASGDFSDLPDDFTYVLHLAAYIQPGEDYESALKVNAEGTGLLLSHCRNARAALVMSSAGVYEVNPDPWHESIESDPLAETKFPYVPTYGLGKLTEEAVARTCSRIFDLPVVISRMNTAYGPNGGLPAFQLDSIIAGEEIVLSGEEMPATPIFQDDINAQAELLLAAATTPALVVNWGGDETLSHRQWCEYLGELSGHEPNLVVKPDVPQGGAVNTSKRRSITGPCKVLWQEGMRRMFEGRYPKGPDGPRVEGVSGAHAMEAFNSAETGSDNG